MSNVFTLDDIRDAADKKYGQLEVDLPRGKKTVLRAPLRLPRDVRAELKAKIEALGDIDSESDDYDEIEVVEGIRAVLLIVGDDNTQLLLDTIGEDDGVLVMLFETYQSTVNPGEASNSPS